MSGLARLVLVLAVLAGCSAYSNERQAGESDVACIARLYDRPTRVASFSVAEGICVGQRPADLTGARYYQLLASSKNIPFVSHDKPGTDTIMLTGSRIPYPTDQPAPPDLRLN